MKIEIPETTPNGRRIETIGLWLSGGVDSSLLLYMLCKSIKDSGRQIRVQPFTIRRPKPYNPLHAVPVVQKVKELLDFDLMNDHIVYYHNIDTDESRNYCNGRLFGDSNLVNFRDRIQLLYSGLTKNPPKEVQMTFNLGISKEEFERGEEEVLKRDPVHHGVDKAGVEHYLITPIKDLNKKDLADLYTELGIMETLFPLTRSCEAVRWKENGEPDHPNYGHCGECWWCDERMWGFGRFE